MASVSVSHMILFIASMLIAASVAGVFTTTVDQLAGAIDDQGLSVSDDVRTDITIISDNGTGACVYDCDGNGDLQLLIKNTGSQRLAMDTAILDVLINNRFQPPGDLTITALGEADDWGPGDVVRLDVSQPSLGSGDHRAKVIVNGDEEVFEFTNP